MKIYVDRVFSRGNNKDFHRQYNDAANVPPLAKELIEKLFKMMGQAGFSLVAAGKIGSDVPDLVVDEATGEVALPTHIPKITAAATAFMLYRVMFQPPSAIGYQGYVMVEVIAMNGFFVLAFSFRGDSDVSLSNTQTYQEGRFFLPLLSTPVDRVDASQNSDYRISVTDAGIITIYHRFDSSGFMNTRDTFFMEPVKSLASTGYSGYAIGNFGTPFFSRARTGSYTYVAGFAESHQSLSNKLTTLTVEATGYDEFSNRMTANYLNLWSVARISKITADGNIQADFAYIAGIRTAYVGQPNYVNPTRLGYTAPSGEKIVVPNGLFLAGPKIMTTRLKAICLLPEVTVAVDDTFTLIEPVSETQTEALEYTAVDHEYATYSETYGIPGPDMIYNPCILLTEKLT